MELATGRVDIGTHNHEVAVLDHSALAAAGYHVSHRDLNDGTVEGLVHASGRIASVGPSRGTPGPIDAARVFEGNLRRAGRCATQPRARMSAPQRVLVIGSGPIVIGQAAEVDYAGVQGA